MIVVVVVWVVVPFNTKVCVPSHVPTYTSMRSIGVTAGVAVNGGRPPKLSTSVKLHQSMVLYAKLSHSAKTRTML